MTPEYIGLQSYLNQDQYENLINVVGCGCICRITPRTHVYMGKNTFAFLIGSDIAMFYMRDDKPFKSYYDELEKNKLLFQYTEYIWMHDVYTNSLYLKTAEHLVLTKLLIV